MKEKRDAADRPTQRLQELRQGLIETTHADGKESRMPFERGANEPGAKRRVAPVDDPFGQRQQNVGGIPRIRGGMERLSLQHETAAHLFAFTRQEYVDREYRGLA